MNNGFYEFSRGKQETTSSVFPYTGSAIISGSLGVVGSLENGLDTIASGLNSHAEGYLTTAQGIYSHAEGNGGTATGPWSHVEGGTNQAIGTGSHAEGAGTIAAGDFQHVQGQFNISSSARAAFIIGNGANLNNRSNLVFASGSTFQVTGSVISTQGFTGSLFGTSSWASNSLTSSFVTSSNVFGPFGSNSIISASFAVSSSRAISSSFAVSASWAPSSPTSVGGSDTQIQFNSGSSLLGTGSFTFNYQSQSLQQGIGVTASGLYSHAQGLNTTASGSYSHAEGASTQALGVASHTEGSGSVARGDYSHAEGFRTITTGSYSHAEGRQARTIGEYSHAEGYRTEASGSHSHAEGAGTLAIGDTSHAEGSNTVALGESSHAEGESTVSIGQGSHAEGLWTVASGSYQHAQGQYNISSSAQSAFIIGNGTADNARSNLVFASGSQFQVTGSVIATQGFTGSLFGTSSFAATASFVETAQTASFVQNAISASYVLQAVSSSFATTASYASNGGVTQLLAGPNISLSPTTGVGQVTISSTGGGGGFNTATGSYGSFYSTVTQTNVASTARSMSLNITDISNGVSISGSTNPYNTYIKTENAGVYDIQFSAQVDKTDSGTDEIWIWLRKNGTDLTDTATSVQLQGNGAHYVAAWNFFVNAAANDYFQLMWYSPDANVRLHAEAGFGVVPGIPSLIVTANRVDQFLSNTGSFSGSFTGQFTGSLFGTASFATTASYASNGGVTSIVAGTNITVSSATGAVTINSTGGGGGGTDLGLVQAMVVGLQNIF